MRKIMDYRRTYTGNILKIDILVEIEGEKQHHYISLDRMANQHDIEDAIFDYINKNVKFRNMSEQEQQNHVIAFKGGRL